MLKKLLRSVSAALTLALLFSILTCAPFSVSAAETGDLAAVAAEPTNPFGELSGGKYTLESVTYQLSDDYALEGYLYVPSYVTAEIDLNGHTLDRALTEQSETGYVIRNEGTLTITDSSGSGKITGGYAVQGGAVYNTGTLTINGGTFTGNFAGDAGGAIYNAENAVLSVTGGTITKNSAIAKAGGIPETIMCILPVKLRWLYIPS